MNKLLQLDHVQKRFGSVAAVAGISLRVEDGEFLALTGRSGSGKSTLLNLLAGLDRPDGGHILYRGSDIAGYNEDALAGWRRQHVGLVFQSFHLIPTLSALENVAFPLYSEPVAPRERRRRALECLEQVGLGHRVTHRPGQLSGGQQQRVAIARALINRPGLILADEPTGNLDSQTGEEILTLFRRLQAEHGVAVIVATHDQKVAAAADRIVHMMDGRAVS